MLAYVVGVTGWSSAWSALERRAGTEQAVKKNDKHDAGEDDIHAVVLFEKSPDRECHACHRRKNEQNESQLDDSPAMQGKGTVEYATQGSQIGRFAAKDVVIRGSGAVA